MQVMTTAAPTQTKQGYCTLCRSRCGTLNEVQGDMLVSVRPDASHPTGQAMCMKGKAAPELVHSPHRLRYPMRRTRPKTEADPGWVRIGWDEALAETAPRLGALKAASGAGAGGVGGVRRDHAQRHATDGQHRLDRALRAPLRQPQHLLRDRGLQLAQGLRAR